MPPFASLQTQEILSEMTSTVVINSQSEVRDCENRNGPESLGTRLEKPTITKEEKRAALVHETRKLIGNLVQDLEQADGYTMQTLRTESSISFSKTPLKAFSTSEAVTYEAFKSSGGLRCIILAIRKYCDVDDVVKHGCQAMLTFTLLDNNITTELIKAGAVDSTVSCVKCIGSKGSADAKVAALKLLRALTQEEESRLEICNAKGVQVVVQAMTHSSECARTMSHGALVLSNLAFGNKEVRDTVGEEGGIAAITKGMKDHADFQAMQARGSLALRNLCFGSEKNQCIGGETGAIECLLEAIQRFKEDREVVHQSCVALCHLTNDNVENRKRIVAAGGTILLVKLMQEYVESSTVHDDCLSVVRNVATESQQAQEEVGDNGGIGVIISALERFKRDEKVCEKGCAALRYLCFLKRNRERVGMISGVEALVKVLKTHVNSKEAVVHALLAIGNATFENDENKEAVGMARGIEAIVQAVEQHRLEVTVQENGCRVLRNLVDGVQHNCKLAVDAGAITMGVFAMMGFSDNASVQEQACAMLFNMARDDQFLDKLRQADVMRLAEKALTHHGKRRGVYLQAGLLMDRMNGYEIRERDVNIDRDENSGHPPEGESGGGRRGKSKLRAWRLGWRD